jgi:YfiH family protein
MLNNNPSYLIPDWPAPENVRAFSTTRLNGCSTDPFSSFNLGAHVHDSPENVAKNRMKLEAELALPSSPFWLEQVHGNSVHIVEASKMEPFPPKADASITQEVGPVCIVMTADCLPILLCSRNGNEVAAVHAGWRGLLNGVIDNTLSQFKSAPSEIMAWLGPAIGPEIFEINEEILVDFLNNNVDNEAAFCAREPNRWFADLYELARIRLRQFGVCDIFGGNFCTYRDSELFFSHRRDKGKTGRMASLIWKL